MPSNFLDDFEHCDPTNVEKQDRKLDGLHLFSLLSHSTWHHHNGNSNWNRMDRKIRGCRDEDATYLNVNLGGIVRALVWKANESIDGQTNNHGKIQHLFQVIESSSIWLSHDRFEIETLNLSHPQCLGIAQKVLTFWVMISWEIFLH